MTPTEATPTLRPPGLGSDTAILALLAFAMLIVSLDQYIVVVALPEIGRGLGYSAQALQAVISAYAVASAGFLLLGGRASDRLGRRRVLASGLALHATGSLAGGLAPTPEALLVARATQGLGGALVFPATLALVNTTFAEGPARNRALAVWGGTGDGVVFTTMFIAAGTGVDDEEQGVASGIVSTSTSIGAAVGIALLVLVAASGTDGLAGEALGAATANGLSTAVLVIAAGIAATALVALNLRPDARTRAQPPCPRGLATATLRPDQRSY